MHKCRTCRAAFVWPQPTPEQLEAFYSRFHLDGDSGGTYEEIEPRMQADFPAKVQLVRQALEGKAGRVLDVGCGKGYFVRACCDDGIDARGVDLSDSGVGHAVEKLKVRAACGSLHDLKDQLGLFDVVTFWATIEHLPDPACMLRDIASVLRPGGRLLMDTGIGDDWLDRLLPGRVQWYDPPQHLFVFSADGLGRVLQAAGFQVERFDKCFERSRGRKAARVIRNALTAAALRLVASAGRLSQGQFTFTRFPLGNLMSVTARKPL